MTDTDTGGKMPPVGPIGRNLIEAVEELRQVRGLSYRKMAEALKRAGRPIFALGLSRMAHGDRRVDVDELVALALVLNVAPASLLFPRHAAPDGVLELTPEVRQRADAVWEWADGEEPLPPEPGAATPAERKADFRRHARPDFDTAGAGPASAAAREFAALVKAAERDPQQWDRQRDDLIRSYRTAGFLLGELLAKGDYEAMLKGAWKFDTAGAQAQLAAAANELRPLLFQVPPAAVDPLDPFGKRDER